MPVCVFEGGKEKENQLVDTLKEREREEENERGRGREGGREVERKREREFNAIKF